MTANVQNLNVNQLNQLQGNSTANGDPDSLLRDKVLNNNLTMNNNSIYYVSPDGRQHLKQELRILSSMVQKHLVQKGNFYFGNERYMERVKYNGHNFYKSANGVWWIREDALEVMHGAKVRDLRYEKPVPKQYNFPVIAAPASVPVIVGETREQLQKRSALNAEEFYNEQIRHLKANPKPYDMNGFARFRESLGFAQVQNLISNEPKRWEYLKLTFGIDGDTTTQEHEQRSRAIPVNKGPVQLVNSVPKQYENISNEEAQRLYKEGKIDASVRNIIVGNNYLKSSGLKPLTPLNSSEYDLVREQFSDKSYINPYKLTRDPKTGKIINDQGQSTIEWSIELQVQLQRELLRDKAATTHAFNLRNFNDVRGDLSKQFLNNEISRKDFQEGLYEYGQDLEIERLTKEFSKYNTPVARRFNVKPPTTYKPPPEDHPQIMSMIETLKRARKTGRQNEPYYVNLKYTLDAHLSGKWQTGEPNLSWAYKFWLENVR